jgi:hypothetical protein
MYRLATGSYWNAACGVLKSAPTESPAMRRSAYATLLTSLRRSTTTWTGRSLVRDCDSVPNRSSKRPRDPNQLAKLIADIATGEVELPKTDEGKDPAAVALGRKGGLKGGRARADKLSAKRRGEIAKKAAATRWKSRRS